MSEAESTPSPSPLSLAYPPAALPTVYADGVLNISHNAGGVKFYLVRGDPPFVGQGGNQMQVITQIVMPLDGFINTALFFEETLKDMAQSNELMQQMIDQIRTARKAE
jgi:hypothetical protein